MGVTKTDFVRGLQCPKMLWLDSHKPLEKIIPEAVQKRLDEGNAVSYTHLTLPTSQQV